MATDTSMLVNLGLGLLPVLWLLVAMVATPLPAYVSSLGALALSLVLACAWWGLGAPEATGAILEGTAFALWNVCLVIVAALFAYDLLAHTGSLDVIGTLLSSITRDRRVVELLIIWGFGNLLEGMAGFGTAVAIPASILVGLGFEPLPIVVASLVANAMPTAFGSVGVPTQTLASVSGMDAIALSGSIAAMELVVMLAMPLVIVTICEGGMRALRGMLPTSLVASVSFAVPWLAVAQVAGPELPNVIGAVCSVCCTVAFMRLRPNNEPDQRFVLSGQEDAAIAPVSETLRACAPFVLMFVLLMVTSSFVPPVHDALAAISSKVVLYPGEDAGSLEFRWLCAPGTIILVAALAGGLIQGLGAREMLGLLAGTLRKNLKTIVTICSIVAAAKVMGYSGMTLDVALALVAMTGGAYPLISPVIGALGGFATGSGTSANVLFGQLQVQAAEAIGASPLWMAASNAMGAGIGKALSTQCVAIGTGATGLSGNESQVFRRVLVPAVACLVVASALCLWLAT